MLPRGSARAAVEVGRLRTRTGLLSKRAVFLHWKLQPATGRSLAGLGAIEHSRRHFFHFWPWMAPGTKNRPKKRLLPTGAGEPGYRIRNQPKPKPKPEPLSGQFGCFGAVLAQIAENIRRESKTRRDAPNFTSRPGPVAPRRQSCPPPPAPLAPAARNLSTGRPVPLTGGRPARPGPARNSGPGTCPSRPGSPVSTTRPQPATARRRRSAPPA